MNGRSKAKRWVVVVNNYTEREEADIEAEAQYSEEVVYAIFGREVGESGTPHLQCYIEYSRRVTLSRVKEVFGIRAHCEVARGGRSANVAYCRKDGDYWEHGTPPVDNQGRRTDLDDVKSELDSGSSIQSIAESNFGLFCRYRNGITAYAQMKAPRRYWKTEVFVLFGEAGAGKTRAVLDEHEDVWIAPDNALLWFDGYRGDSVVLFDDFSKCQTLKEFDVLLKLMDRYPMMVPVKGGFVQWSPRFMFVTSNKHPDEWVGHLNLNVEQWEAFHRRIDKLWRYTRSPTHDVRLTLPDVEYK